MKWPTREKMMEARARAKSPKNIRKLRQSLRDKAMADKITVPKAPWEKKGQKDAGEV